MLGQGKELNMQHAVHNCATIRVADRTDVSGRVTADEVNLDRFHNRIGKVCVLVAARSKAYLSAAAALLIVTLAGPAVAQEQVPNFSGTIQGQETDAPPPPLTVSASIIGTGIASHLGQLQSFKFELTVANHTATGFGQFVAANGDRISTYIVGFLAPTSTPGVASITEIDTITGGTGRFMGAQGSFKVERLLNTTGDNPHFTSGSFQGTITFPGATQ
jgi:hypothetical protein